MRAGTRRNVGTRQAKRRCALQPGVSLPGCEKRRPRRARGGVTGTVAASLPLTLRQLGWKPAAPKGPGRDSAAGSVRSMTAPVPVREVARSQRNQKGNGRSKSRMRRHRHRHRHRHRQRIITGRKKTTHTGQKKPSPGMRKIRPATGRMHQEWRYFLTSSSFLAYSGAFLSGSCSLNWR